MFGWATDRQHGLFRAARKYGYVPLFEENHVHVTAIADGPAQSPRFEYWETFLGPRISFFAK